MVHCVEYVRISVDERERYSKFISLLRFPPHVSLRSNLHPRTASDTGDAPWKVNEIKLLVFFIFARANVILVYGICLTFQIKLSERTITVDETVSWNVNVKLPTTFFFVLWLQPISVCWVKRVQTGLRAGEKIGVNRMIVTERVTMAIERRWVRWWQ